MATIYKVFGKNVGKDVSITITDSLGNQVNAAQIGILTEFDVSAEYEQSETKSLINGGQTFHESLPHGAKCSMKFARTTGALEEMETSYRSNSQDGNQVIYQVQYQTKNRDGSINTRKLVDCKPHNWNLGSYKAGTGDVSQSVDFISGDIENNGASTNLFRV